MQTFLFRCLVAGSVLLFNGFSGDAGPDRTAAKKSPLNVVFISVDDLKPNLGCYGDTMAISPNIDRLAEMGTLMRSSYCQQAICAPSRISVFTGMRPDYTGVRDLRTHMREERPDILTLPQYFMQQGYLAYGYGKLMHGAPGNDPSSWTEPVPVDGALKYAAGFEYPANGQYQGDGPMEAFREAKSRGLSWGETNRYMKSNGVRPSTEFMEVPDDAYRDGAIARAGVERLEALAVSGQPFFLAIGLRKPHLPFAAPRRYYEMYAETEFDLAPFRKHAANAPEYAYTEWPELRSYSDIPGEGGLTAEKQRELIRGYYSALSYADAQVGKILRKLAALDLLDNTVVVLWGDHGWHLGDHGLWCKHTNFEEATRAPLILYAPGYEGGQIGVSMSEFVDIFPTVCELAGVPVPEGLHGKSLVPVMHDPGVHIKDYAVSQYPRWNDRMGYTLRTERYRLTVWMKDGWIASEQLFVEDYVAEVEMYDYAEDPLETVSVAGTPAYKNMEAALMNYMKAFFSQSLREAKVADR